jgi:radical SAM-linked protein
VGPWPSAAASRTLPDVLGAPESGQAARQRWRIRFARDHAAADLSQRDEAEAWSSAIARSRLAAVTVGDPPRPRVTHGPPLPTGALALDEPLELFLGTRVTVDVVRKALEDIAPLGHHVRRVHDVWLGAPALQAVGRAVDYGVRVAGAPRGDLTRATEQALATEHLPRERVRGARTVRFDLRPSLEIVTVEPDERAGSAPDAAVLRFRVRLDPERGVVRPDEVVSVLAELVDAPLRVVELVRTRVWLADDPAPGAL